MRPIHSGMVQGLLVTASLASAQPPAIVHEPVACAVAEKFPRLSASFDPPGKVAVARLLFQGQTADWYSVVMKPEGASFVGVLPKPRKELKSFRYYVEVTDKALGVSRTTEFTTSIVPSSGACKGGLVSATVASASVVLQGPAGLAALPAGFASSGVVTGTAVGSGGAAGAAGASAGSAGGGFGATAAVIGGVAVAGGAAAIAAGKSGGDDSSGASGSSGPGGSGSGSIVSVSFLPSPPGIDVSVCAGRQLIWSSQTLNPGATNTFNETWAPNEPNTVRVTGQISATNFEVTIACTNGARTGTISATGSNGVFNGTFSFGPSTGQVRVTRQ